MPVICFFLPCLGWLSFCRFLHCNSLMNLALMFPFVNQTHQVPSAPLYLSCSKIYCLYCFPLVEPEIWHPLFWDLRTWLIPTPVRNACPCFTVLPVLGVGEWACFTAVQIPPHLFFSSLLTSDPFLVKCSWCISWLTPTHNDLNLPLTNFTLGVFIGFVSSW